MASLDSFEVIDESMASRDHSIGPTIDHCQETCSHLIQYNENLRQELTEACEMMQEMMENNALREVEWKERISSLERQLSDKHEGQEPSTALTAPQTRNPGRMTVQNERLTREMRTRQEHNVSLQEEINKLTDKLRSVEEERDALTRRISNLDDDLSDALKLAQDNASSQAAATHEMFRAVCSVLHIQTPASLPADNGDLRQMLDHVVSQHQASVNIELSHREAKLMAAEQIICDQEAELKSLTMALQTA